MINRYVLVLAALAAILGGVWWHGRTSGYTAAAAEQQREVARVEREMDALKRESDARLAAKANELAKKEMDYRERIKRLSIKDDTFRAWLEVPVHPAAVGIIRGLRDEAGGGSVPGGPGAGPGTTTARAIARRD